MTLNDRCAIFNPKCRMKLWKLDNSITTFWLLLPAWNFYRWRSPRLHLSRLKLSRRIFDVFLHGSPGSAARLGATLSVERMGIMLEVWQLFGIYIVNNPVYWPIVLLGSTITYVSLKLSRDFSALFFRRYNKAPSYPALGHRLPLATHIVRTPSCWSVVMVMFILVGATLKFITDILSLRFRRSLTAWRMGVDLLNDRRLIVTGSVTKNS